jgi:predicted nucleic acid-binding protein
VAERLCYKKPYFDACVFLGWILGERIPLKVDGKFVIGDDGEHVFEERTLIAEHLLKLASQGIFPVVTSALTLAEVHKHRGKDRLSVKNSLDFLAYCEHDFITIVAIDRDIGEEANILCQKYRLFPNDAIHLACAKKADCDVLLSWDGPLNRVADAGIRIEKPVMWTPPEKPKQPVQLTMSIREVQ